MTRTILRLLPALALLSGSCRVDPCGDAAPISVGSATGGAASLRLEVVEQRGRPGYPADAMACFGVTVLPHDSYADTLHAAYFAPAGPVYTVHGLPVGRADVIVDRIGYFPVKLVDVPLAPAGDRAPMKVFLYPRDVPFVYPGELIVALKPDVPFASIEPTVRGMHGVEIQATPEAGYFQLRYPVGDLRQFRSAAEHLTRRLLASPYVREAGPATSVGLLAPNL